MISSADQERIKALTLAYWQQEVKAPSFAGIFKGKEIGHRIADYVDERTTAMLEQSFPVAHELDDKGKRRARSMGDVWIKSGGIYNPLNVKAGEAGKNGQPNMVSLTKLLDALIDHEIDSYYLLIVKMRLRSLPAAAEVDDSELQPDTIVPNVYLVDMLDWLSFVTFDAGPGQTMLKEKSFYEAADAGHVPAERTLSEKVSSLIDLLEDGDRRLIKNRADKMDRLRTEFQRYGERGGRTIKQEGLKLG